jgi:hypothetical protein
MTCQVQQQSSARDSVSSADAESLRRENSQLKQEVQVRQADYFAGLPRLKIVSATEIKAPRRCIWRR